MAKKPKANITIEDAERLGMGKLAALRRRRAAALTTEYPVRTEADFNATHRRTFPGGCGGRYCPVCIDTVAVRPRSQDDCIDVRCNVGGCELAAGATLVIQGSPSRYLFGLCGVHVHALAVTAQRFLLPSDIITYCAGTHGCSCTCHATGTTDMCGGCGGTPVDAEHDPATCPVDAGGPCTCLAR